VEWIDLKESTLCTNCQTVATPGAQVSSARFF
jgi:hypothetical protein